MAVTYDGMLNPGGLKWSFDGSDGTRRYRFVHKLKSDTAPNLVATSLAIYSTLLSNGVDLGTTCPLDTGALCNEIAIDEVVPRMLPSGGTSYWEWHVGVGYSSKVGETLPSNEKDPLNRPATITFGIEHFTAEAEKDLNDDNTVKGPVTNSAGDPQVREVRRGKLLIRIQKNVAAVYDWRNFREARYDKPSEKGFVFSRNAAAWNVYGPYGAIIGSNPVPAGEALCVDLSGTISRDNNSSGFMQLSGAFLIDTKAHDDIFFDVGFHYLKSGNPVQFVERGGWAMTPQMLNGSGGPASPGITTLLAKQYYPTRDWSSLGLP